ncbi:MAG: gliding motility-associated C-terminal domain-containing protein [bacterium]|nr:gliding motility-associated C-terminal domain-containing protein [bacterium]
MNLTIFKKNIIKNIIVHLFQFIFICPLILFAQNSLTGDSFGGRLWYKPYNYVAGGSSGYAICEDSSQLYGWGNNVAGELGRGYYPLGTTTPFKAIDMTNIRYCSSGLLSAGAIKNDKTGWVWGYIGGVNYVPKQIISNAKFVDAGTGLCAFVKHDGTVWSLGLNNYGTFGNGTITTNNKYTQTLEKMTGITRAVRVAVSGYTTSILLSDGSVMSTGTNFEGCLGDNSQLNSSALIPVNVIGLKDIIDIKATTQNIIALDKNGDVFVWGSATGTGILNSKTAYFPKKIPTLKNIIAISGCAPGYHFLALDSNHNCFGWGSNGFGQLGDTTIFNFDTPTLIATDVDDIMTGNTFSYFIKSDGTLWASGSSYYGSIWMNLSNTKRGQFTQLSPNLPPFNLCNPSPFNPRTLTSIDVSICPGDSFIVGNKIYKLNGNYRDTLPSSSDIDSIIFTHLTTKSVSFSTQNLSICQGEKLIIGIHSYTKAGNYLDTFASYLGCDSVLTTNLTINGVSKITNSISLCQGGNYKIGKNTYYSAGSFQDTITNYKGCDSIVTSIITLRPIPVSMQNIKICEGEHYSIGKNIYTNAGTYIDTLSNQNGCDSIVYSTIVSIIKPNADFYYRYEFPNIGDTVRFYNLSKGANTYQWNFNSTSKDTSSITNPFYIYPDEGIKYIQLITTNINTGCMDTAIKAIEVINKSVIYIPSTFSPNGDGLNDFFFPITLNFDLIHTKIFNRWGESVFESNAFLPGWDGKYKEVLCMKGIYTYIMEFSNYLNSKKQIVTGIVFME